MSGVGITLENASIVRGSVPHRHRVADGVNLAVGPGSSVAIMGASGAGKSSLALALAGLIPLEHGRRVCVGTHPVVMLLQRPESALIEDVVFDDVALALGIHGVPVPQVVEAASTALARAGVPRELWRRDPLQLSGGEQRRVALAGVLAVRPGLLIVDEPTAGLDALSRAGVHETLRDLVRSVVTLIVVTHDPVEAAPVTSQLVCVEHGKVHPAQPTMDVLGDARRARSYGIAPLPGADLVHRLGIDAPPHDMNSPTRIAAAIAEHSSEVSSHAPASSGIRRETEMRARMSMAPARTDPRRAICAFALLLAATFIATSVAGVACALAAAVAATVMTRVDRRSIRSSIVPLICTVLVLAVLQMLVAGQQEVALLGTQTITSDAVAVAMRGSQVIAAILGSLALASALGPSGMADGLRWWLAPLRLVRLPVNEIALMLSLGIGFAPVLNEQLVTIDMARRARGIEMASLGITARIRLRASTMSPLIVGALRSGRCMGETMHVRGFHGRAARTYWRPYPRRGTDALVVLVALLLVVGSIVL